MFIGFVCLFCGILFLGIGIWACRQEKPVHFYSGLSVSPESIRDIPAYNRACGRMWKGYSALWFVCTGAAAWLGTSIWMVVLLLCAAIPGSIWLVLKYHRIEKTYRR